MTTDEFRDPGVDLGLATDPANQQRAAYAGSDPVNGTDPDGHLSAIHSHCLHHIRACLAVSGLDEGAEKMTQKYYGTNKGDGPNVFRHLSWTLAMAQVMGGNGWSQKQAKKAVAGINAAHEEDGMRKAREGCGDVHKAHTSGMRKCMRSAKRDRHVDRLNNALARANPIGASTLVAWGSVAAAADALIRNGKAWKQVSHRIVHTSECDAPWARGIRCNSKSK